MPKAGATSAYKVALSISVVDTAGSPRVEFKSKGEFRQKVLSVSGDKKVTLRVVIPERAAVLAIGGKTRKALLGNVEAEVVLKGARALSVRGVNAESARVIRSVLAAQCGGGLWFGQASNREMSVPLDTLGSMKVKLSSGPIEKLTVGGEPCVLVETVGFGSVGSAKKGGFKDIVTHLRSLSLVSEKTGAVVRSSIRSRTVLTGLDGTVSTIWNEVEIVLDRKAFKKMPDWPEVAGASVFRGQGSIAAGSGSVSDAIRVAGSAGLALLCVCAFSAYVLSGPRGRYARFSKGLSLVLAFAMTLLGLPLDTQTAAAQQGGAASLSRALAAAPEISGLVMPPVGAGAAGVGPVCAVVTGARSGMERAVSFLQTPAGARAWRAARQNEKRVAQSLSEMRKAACGCYFGRGKLYRLSGKHIKLLDESVAAGLADVGRSAKLKDSGVNRVATGDEVAGRRDLAAAGALLRETYRRNYQGSRNVVEFAESYAKTTKQMALAAYTASGSRHSALVKGIEECAANAEVVAADATRSLRSLLSDLSTAQDYRGTVKAPPEKAPLKSPKKAPKPTFWSKYKWWIIIGGGVAVAGGTAAALAGGGGGGGGDDEGGGGGGGGGGGVVPDVTVGQNNINITVWDPNAAPHVTQIDVTINGVPVPGLTNHVLQPLPGTQVAIALVSGNNTVVIHADNVGGTGLNEGVIRFSHVTQGNIDHPWALNAGQDKQIIVAAP